MKRSGGDREKAISNFRFEISDKTKKRRSLTSFGMTVLFVMVREYVTEEARMAGGSEQCV